MRITNTFTSHDPEERRARQAALHRRCILLLQAAKARSQR